MPRKAIVTSVFSVGKARNGFALFLSCVISSVPLLQLSHPDQTVFWIPLYFDLVGLCFILF